MSKEAGNNPPQAVTPEALAAALLALREVGVAFRGPFLTSAGNRIYLVEGCVLSESELVSFHVGGRFAPEGLKDFLAGLKAQQARKPEFSGADQVSPPQRRRSQRILLRLNVLVAFDLPEAGHRQTHAFTVYVNAHGGLLESPFRMTTGQRLTLINPQTGKEVHCTVIEVHRSADGFYQVAFEFEMPCPQFWAIAFPPPDWGMTKESA